MGPHNVGGILLSVDAKWAHDMGNRGLMWNLLVHNGHTTWGSEVLCGTCWCTMGTRHGDPRSYVEPAGAQWAHDMGIRGLMWNLLVHNGHTTWGSEVLCGTCWCTMGTRHGDPRSYVEPAGAQWAHDMGIQGPDRNLRSQNRILINYFIYHST